jgi:hypothetical protein
MQLIPDAARQERYSALQFSRQALRGMALAKRGDRLEAGFWLELIEGANQRYQRPTVELGLALSYEKSGQLAKVFAADSPITDSFIRRRLLVKSAGPAILRAQAQNTARRQEERDVALFTLLHKELSRGKYADFNADLKLVRADANADAGLWGLAYQEQVPLGLFRKAQWSDGYPCPPLIDTAAMLARNANSVQGRLCLGDFYRLNGFDDFSLERYSYPEMEKGLGDYADEFPGKAVHRSEFYDAIIADRSASRGDKAYALYRAIRCYAPAGNSTCGGEEVPESQRKAWFQTLKNQYGDTQWARDLEYYW